MLNSFLSLATGRGGVVTIEVDSNGTVTKATVTSPGSGYKSGDILRISSPNGGGADARLQVPGSAVSAVRGDSAEGSLRPSVCATSKLSVEFAVLLTGPVPRRAGRYHPPLLCK